MNKGIAQKWYDALTSGQYVQGRTALKTGNIADGLDSRHCCIGVLCDLVDPTGFGLDAEQKWHHRGMGGRMGPVVREASRLTTEDESAFISMNDQMKCNFTQIAAEIKRRYL